MEQNMFTDEQFEILRKGFREHDFTQTAPLNPLYENMTPELVNTIIRRIEIHNPKKVDGQKCVKADIYFTGVGLCVCLQSAKGWQ